MLRRFWAVKHETGNEAGNEKGLSRLTIYYIGYNYKVDSFRG